MTLLVPEQPSGRMLGDQDFLSQQILVQIDYWIDRL